MLCILLTGLVTEAQLNGKSVQIKADYNYISVPDASSLLPNSDMTIEAWLYYKCENGATGNMIMSKGWCGTPDWTFYFNIVAQKLRLAKWRNGFSNCSGNQAIYETNEDVIPFNEWVHVAVTLSASNVVTFYVNGEAKAGSLISGTDGPGFNASNFPLLIGASRSLSNVYSSLVGNLDEVRIWHTVRTMSEIQSTMNVELTGNETGLYAYWKMNETGNGASITVTNAASATAGLYNGTTAGTAANIKFTSNDTILNGMPLCDPVLWLRADSSVVYDGSNRVSQWMDVSGNGNHVTQTNTANQPLFQSNVINSKPSIYFDGSSGKYFLNNTTANLVNSGLARTVFVSGKRDCKIHASGVIGGSLFTFRRTGLINTLTFGANSAATPVYIYSDNNGIGNNNASIGANSLDTAQRNMVITYDVPAAGNQIKVRLNGAVQSVNQGTGSITAETGTTGFTVGDREDQADLDWSGWMNEVIVFNRSLTVNEIQTIEKYLQKKYPQSPSIFNSVPTALQTSSSTLMDDGIWKHSYNSAENNKVIASVRDYCLDLGTRSDTVYVDPSAVQVGSTFYMRRHYVIKTSLNPSGLKRIRLYYTDSDFANLQSAVTTLTSHSQLSVTKYDGIQEDGVFDAAAGTITFIPSSQITTGIAYGLHYLEFDVTDFSEFWIHPFNIPLSLNLISFNAYACREQACLQWSLQSDQKTSFVQIERSADGIHFDVMQQMETTTSQSNYSYTDVQPFYGDNYYRLRMLQPDNKAIYSEVKHLYFGKGTWSTTIYPTYSQDGNYTIQSNLPIEKVEIFTVSGQRCDPMNIDHQVLDVQKLATGIYFVRMYAGGMVQTKRIIR